MEGFVRVRWSTPAKTILHILSIRVNKIRIPPDFRYSILDFGFSTDNRQLTTDNCLARNFADQDGLLLAFLDSTLFLNGNNHRLEVLDSATSV